MKSLKNTLLVLSTGYIFVFFSENLFWARIRPDDSLKNWLSAWIAYSLMSFVYLHLVSYFRVRNIWALFLTGAIFGWLAEGVIVHTAYDQLPLSISFTGLSWHALITIMVGWYAVRKSLTSSNPFFTMKLATAIGLCYGLWATFWWLEPDGGVASLPLFSRYSLTITFLFILSCWLANWSSSERFLPNRRVTMLIYSLFVLYFLFITVPAAPIAIGILPVLLGLAYSGLFRNRMRDDREGSYIDDLQGPIPVWKYLGLLTLPMSAILVYSLAMSMRLSLHFNAVLYIITTPLGFIFFCISLYKTWCGKTGNPSVNELKITL